MAVTEAVGDAVGGEAVAEAVAERVKVAVRERDGAALRVAEWVRPADLEGVAVCVGVTAADPVREAVPLPDGREWEAEGRVPERVRLALGEVVAVGVGVGRPDGE